MWQELQICCGHIQFFCIDPLGRVSKGEYNGSPFEVVSGLSQIKYSESDLIISTIHINEKFTGAFSYDNICNFDIDMIKDLVSLAKTTK